MQKFNYYILIPVNIISIIFCIINLQNISNELVFFPLCIITSFTIFLILKRKIVINLRINKQMALFSIILCFVFLIMLPILSVLNKMTLLKQIMVADIFLKIIFCLSLIFSLFFTFILIFSYENKNNDCKNTRKIIMIINIIISLLFIGSTSTGFYDADFPAIWNRIDNWHTFGFSFLIHLCKNVLNNPYLIIIINFILYLYFCNYALKIMERQFQNKYILICFFIINLFVLVGFDQLRYIKKDILFSLSFCILILSFVDCFILNKLTKKIIIHLMIFSTMIVLFRHGGLYFLLIIYFIFFIVILIRNQYSQIKYIVIIVITFLTSNFIINYIGINIFQGGVFLKNVIYTVPIYQVGSFVNNGYVFDFKSKSYLERYLPVNYMKENFVKYNGDALARISSDQIYDFNYSGLIKINYNLFIDNPSFYITSLLDLTNILWKIERDNNEWLAYFYKYDWQYDEKQNLHDSTINYKSTILNEIIDPIVNICLKSFLFDIRVKGALPLFCFILSSFLLIIKKQYSFLIPIIFIFIWYLLLFLSLPMGMTRYCLPFINLYPFILCFTLGIKKNV